MPLEEFLRVTLRDQPLVARFEGKTIFLSRKHTPGSSEHPDHVSLPDLLTEILPPPIIFRVYDSEKRPLAGASFSSESNKSKGALGLTNAEGVLSLNVSRGDRLQVSFVGYEPLSFIVTEEMINAGSYEVSLSISDSKLNEVVVIGYGTVKKKDLTGSVSVVEGSDLSRKNETRLSTALQGMVPGLTVTRSSSIPGSNSGTIRIRGITTIGNSDPLILVDGIAVE